MQKRIAIALHAGTGPDNTLIKGNLTAFKLGLTQAIYRGHKVLQIGGSALDAIEEAVALLEDNPLYKAARGAAMNSRGEIELDAVIMDGKNMKAGAVSMLRNIKNPIKLARVVMSKTNHIRLTGKDALVLANDYNLEIESDTYFVTGGQYYEFIKDTRWMSEKELYARKSNGTVGAVALDKYGRLAAATSTGEPGVLRSDKINESWMIGSTCYADSRYCAVSTCGDKNTLTQYKVARTICDIIKTTGCSIQNACDQLIRDENINGDIGIVAIDTLGHIGLGFNGGYMMRAWIANFGAVQVDIY